MLKSLAWFTKGICGARTDRGVTANLLCQWQLTKPVLRQRDMFVFNLFGGWEC